MVASVFDATGNRTQMKLNTVRQTTYTLDLANRLTKITDEVNGAYNFTYDNADRILSMTRPNTVKETLAYDGISRLTQLKQAKGTTVLSQNDYVYNPANQISQIAELAQTRNFNYDSVDRLTGVTGSVAENYAFDAVGNRTTSHLSASYGYQPFNKLTSTASASYAYNANGNMTSKTDVTGTTQYIWDTENRLKQVVKPDTTSVTYKYDAIGRRSERTLSTGTWTRFTYDGPDVIKDTNSDSTTVSYLNGLGIDNKLKQIAGGQTSYFLQDHLGSTRALTNSTGTVTESTGYDSFGRATNSNFSSRYQFTGREYDSLTGLQYSRARFYDPNLGRFISEDPIGFGGGDMNLYGYVKNRPLKYRDARGLDDADKPWYSEIQTPGCISDPDNPSPGMQAWCPFSELNRHPNTAYEQGWKTQGKHFQNGDPQGGTDPYNGGYRHCVSACILAKRYGAFGNFGRFFFHDLPNEILWPKLDSQADLDAESRGTSYGMERGCGSCEGSCLKSFPGTS